MTDQPHLKTVGAPAAAYNDLKFNFANLHTLFSIRGMLSVDMMTVMPTGGLVRRLHDISAVTKRIYTDTTSNTMTRLLDQAEEHLEARAENWDAWDIANLKEMRRIHSHLSALPPDLYITSVHVASEGRQRHADAMQSGDWSEARKSIAQTVDLYRRVGELKQKKFDVCTPYKALLLGYASDICTTQMDALYDALLKPLATLRDKAIAWQDAQEPPVKLEGEFTRGDQMWLNKTVMEIMGFDFTRGSLQVTALSPMCGGNKDDTRILVRCGDSNTFLDSMEDTLYQGARGLYLQNLPADWATQPVGQALGSLMTNSLSIFYETIIGRTPQFFEFISTRAEGVFRQFRNKSFEPENLYRLKKIITPGARRDQADELTKIFHDVMRYRIERDLINGSLSVDDLVDRWNADSMQYLGIKPTSAAEGPLQNPDWFTGRFGYIPTNTLSHIIAASLHEKLFAEKKNLANMVEFGDLRPINQWMKEHIHSKGRSEGTLSLVQSITGAKLSPVPLLDHLERRYLSGRR